MLKVIHICKHYPRMGGIETYIRTLCSGLTKSVELTVLACNNRLSTEDVNIDGVRVIKVPTMGEILSMPLGLTMPFWLRKLKADVIHLHHPYPLGELSCLLTRPKAKIVVTWHSDIVKQKTALRFYRPFLLELLRRCDRIIAPTPRHIENSSFLGRFTHKCEVIPFGINTEQFSMDDHQKRQAVGDIRRQYGGKIVLFVGRLVYYKGLEHLIRAMQMVDAGLLVLGQGPLEGQLKNLVGRLGLSDKVIFVGPVGDKELVDYYHACDVFVLPSDRKSEAFGIVQLEAMAAGKPVVSTDLPTGVPWVNQHGKTGLVVQPGAPAALALAINMLLDNPVTSLELGANGRRRVLEHFSMGQMVQNTLRLYEELLGR